MRTSTKGKATDYVLTLATLGFLTHEGLFKFLMRHPRWSRQASTAVTVWCCQGKYHCTIDLLFNWFGIGCMTTDNFCFYLQNRLIQTSHSGCQWYSNTSPLVFPVVAIAVISFLMFVKLRQNKYGYLIGCFLQISMIPELIIPQQHS